MNTDFAGIISASIRMSIPLGFAAIAGAISETSGITAMGLEGYMTIGAFAGVVGAYFSGSAFVGVLFAGLCGCLIAGILALFCIKFKSNQIVAGVGINILAPGLVSLIMVSVFGNKGKSEMVSGLKEWKLPLIDQIPIIGKIFSGYTGLVYLLFVLMIVAWVVVFHTPIGIRLRATGQNAEAVDSLGLGSKRIQYFAVCVSGILAGIGGSYLSLSQLNFYSKDMVAGRGFIAIAIFVFAKKNPIGCVLAALLFGFTEAIQLRLQSLAIPSQFLQMLPYLCTLIVLCINIKKKVTVEEIKNVDTV